MTAFQIDYEKEVAMKAEAEPAIFVAGRHLQNDADILCYNYADLEATLAENKQMLIAGLDFRRIMAGAEIINTHTTLGAKAGREEVAQIKEYQVNRKQRDPEQQARVKGLRMFLSTYKSDTVNPCPWFDREADDGMAQYQIAAIEATGIESTVIDTVDKDLRMVPGLHMNHHTFEFVEVTDGYGEIWLDDTKSTKKLVGWGKSFFFAQLLMGDGADAIPGLPGVGSDILNHYCPTKAITHAKSHKAKMAAMGKRKAGKCGAVTAFAILESCRTELDAYKRVLAAYQSHYSTGPIQSFRDETIHYSPTIALLEQARLLWMQRVPGEDVLEYFKELK